VRIAKFKQQITDTLEAGGLELFQRLIEDYEQAHDVPAIEVAAALAKMFRGDVPLLLKPEPKRSERSLRRSAPSAASATATPAPRRARGRRAQLPRAPGLPKKERVARAPDAGMETFRIEVGYDHGVKPGNIVGAIANEAQLEAKHIGRIEIFEDHSFVDLPAACRRNHDAPEDRVVRRPAAAHHQGRHAAGHRRQEAGRRASPSRQEAFGDEALRRAQALRRQEAQAQAAPQGPAPGIVRHWRAFPSGEPPCPAPCTCRPSRGHAEGQRFRTRERAAAPLEDGQFRVAVKFLSIDPAMRVWMSEAKSYWPPVPLGEVMRAQGIGEIVESKNPKFPVGQWVSAMTGVQDEYIGDGKGAHAFDAKRLPHPGWALSVFGATGMTAYFGLTDIGQAKAGEVLVVSAPRARSAPARCRSARRWA
jgi:hypothetical protein